MNKIIGILLVVLITLVGWFRLLDWLEKRRRMEAAQRAEEYKSREKGRRNNAHY